jgi:hypothetical protein
VKARKSTPYPAAVVRPRESKQISTMDAYEPKSEPRHRHDKAYVVRMREPSILLRYVKESLGPKRLAELSKGDGDVREFQTRVSVLCE